MAHCRGAEARYQKNIYEAVSGELNREGLCRQSDSWSGVGEETRDAPDPPRQRKRSALSCHLTGLASLSVFLSGIPLKYLGPTQRCFSEYL
jgi:hypothetical protein